MQLTPDQVDRFQTEGWLAVPDFWNEREIAAMRVELERLVAIGKLRNIATDGDGVTHSKTAFNLQLCPMSPHSDLFRAMPFAPKVAEAVGCLIGEPVVFHLDQVFLKPGRYGSGTNWHKDDAYFKIDAPLKGTALWTAVHDATIANGTLRVIPRMFYEELPHERDPQSDHHIRCFPDESKAVAVEIPAGGVIFFAYGTPHATGANNTAHERAGVALHFINADQNGVALTGFEREKRPILTGAEATGGVREYGVKIAGTWEREVERVLALSPFSDATQGGGQETTINGCHLS